MFSDFQISTLGLILGAFIVIITVGVGLVAKSKKDQEKKDIQKK